MVRCLQGRGHARAFQSPGAEMNRFYPLLSNSWEGGHLFGIEGGMRAACENGRLRGLKTTGHATRRPPVTQMDCVLLLFCTTKSTFVRISERELTFEVNSPTHLGGLTFKELDSE